MTSLGRSFYGQPAGFVGKGPFVGKALLTQQLSDLEGDPRVEEIDRAHRALESATNGEYSREDQIVIDGLRAGSEFAIKLVRRETHIRQLLEERAAAEARHTAERDFYMTESLESAQAEILKLQRKIETREQHIRQLINERDDPQGIRVPGLDCPAEDAGTSTPTGWVPYKEP